MATRDSIQISIKVINEVNRMSTILRSAAESVLAISSNIDGLIAIQDKLDILTEGLTALGVNISNLNSDKTGMVNMANNIKNNIPELTDF